MVWNKGLTKETDRIIFKKDRKYIKMKTKCEIYSRVCGYLRPITDWNEGKISEFYSRTNFNLKKPFIKKNEQTIN